MLQYREDIVKLAPAMEMHKKEETLLLIYLLLPSIRPQILLYFQQVSLKLSLCWGLLQSRAIYYLSGF